MAIKHVVVFEFRPEARPDQIEAIMRALAGFVGQIPGVMDFEGGAYSGPYPGAEGLNKAYTHGFIMTFRDRSSREAYLPHPVHVAFKDQLVPLLRDVMAFDFEVGIPASKAGL